MSVPRRNIMTLRKKTGPGIKGPGDRITFIKTDGWHKITFNELLGLIQDFFENEDRCYPPEEGLQGRNMLFEAIKNVHKQAP